MNFRLKLFELTSDIISTEYDIVSLPYLLMYVMGSHNETHEGYSLSPAQIADTLLKRYPSDFALSNNAVEYVVFDVFDIWERYCSIWDIIKTIGLFA